ncbi:dienelactone hydrolase family protein [Legionella septentrionalis]|uniref:dienelactone hydrolase family protein n=1 Tax=Legionella septentrionalis TaxID=2498109 RepID=UPI000F8CA2FC|nr:dienelactone hydrolase family protein [Legionella septentrionalis]RUR09351.1 carboxymethylenebutenolidase [Legionella septentrionalis]
MHTEELIYCDGPLTCRGFIAYQSDGREFKPCVLIAHDWTGRSEAMCQKAMQLAQEGYVGFAIDVYGDGKLAQTTEEKRAWLYPFKENRLLVAQRMLMAYHSAAALPMVNRKQIAAIGYCFGGMCVLDLARTGIDIKGVVSFHGLLNAPPESKSDSINAKILVLHGYEDAFVPSPQIYQFAEEMSSKKADWQFHTYGLIHHSFTNPLADDAELGLHYNKAADQRSWQSMKQFLQELFC